MYFFFYNTKAENVINNTKLVTLKRQMYRFSIPRHNIKVSQDAGALNKFRVWLKGWAKLWRLINV